MSRVDTKTHHQRNESSSSNILHPFDTSTNIASPSVHSDQPPYARIFPPPRGRPRGNTFGMPGPDTGKIPTLFASTDKSRLGVTPEPQSAAKQHQEKEDEPVSEDDHDDEDPEDVMEGSHNEEHTIDINMPQLSVNRRPRADSYVSIMSNYSNTRGRDGGSARGTDLHHHPSTADGSFMHINRSRSSLYTTGGAISPLDRSFYERDDQDRSSMLTTSTTLNFTHDWSKNEPRGSIATLTFGAGFGESSTSAPAYTTRRISVIDGIAGTSGSEDGAGVAGIGTTTNGTPTTTSAFTSFPASIGDSTGDGGAGLRSGVSPSPTTSLLQSSSHGHNNATYKNPALSRNSPLLFSHQHHSPRPSIDSLRSNHTLLGASKLADKSNSEGEHSKHSGVLPSPSTRMGADTRATISMGVGGSSAMSPTMTARINDRNGIHPATALSPIPSSPSLLGRQRQPRPPRPSQPTDIAHVIHRSDSLEKLETKRRSTVSSAGSTSTSFFGNITSVFHTSNNSNNSVSFNPARASAGAGTTPGEAVRRPKSSSGGSGGVSRLAIGISQQDRWERERERQRGVVKGKEKEIEYSHDNKPFNDTLLHHQLYHRRPQPISIPSDSPSIVSPNGSVFIESFSSPVEDIDGAYGPEVQGDQDKTGQEVASSFHSVPDSTSIQHDPAPFQMTASEPLALGRPSTTIAGDNLVNNESSGRFNPSSILTRSKDRREHYILGPGQQIDGPHQGIFRRRESDGKAGDGTGADRDKEDQEDDAALSTTTTELLSSFSPASSRSNHFFHNHGRLLLNGVDDVEDETIIRRRTHGHGSNLHNAVQSHTLSNANVDFSSKPTTTIYSGPTSSNPNNLTLSRRPSADAPDRPPDLLKFTFPSSSLSFTIAPTPARFAATQAPVQTTSASPTRRLLHSFSQPSLGLSAQSQAAPPLSKSQLDKAYRHPTQPSPTPSSVAANEDLVQIDPHPYAMYSPGSRYHHPGTTTNASVVANTNQILTVLPANTTPADKKSTHPYSNAYQRSIQMQDTNVRMHYPTVPQGRHEPRLMATASGIATSSNDEAVKSQAMSSPHGLKRTLRSSFKLPRSSTPNSAAVHSLSGVVSPNSETLNATPAGHTSTGGNLRSSIRSSVSMPNLGSLFKFGQSHDNNKSHARDDVIRSANAKGITSSAAPQPTTPKKARRLKTQYTAETWCDALLFPRPRFRAHVTSPPPSPIHVSALSSANSQNDTYPQSQSSPGSLDWAVPVTGTSSPNLVLDTLPHQPRTPTRESRFVADSTYSSRVVPPPPKLKAPPKGKPRKSVVDPVLPSFNLEADAADVDPQPKLSTLEQVLIEGEIRNREREQWSGIAKSSFQNMRSRSLSRSRKRAGTTTSTLTSSSAAPSSFEHHGRGRGRTRNHSDAGRKSDERTMTHGTASSISRSLAAGLTTIVVEAFRQPTPTISTVSHHGGHGENHNQTATMTTDTHSNGYHSRTTSESGPAGQRHGNGSSHTRNTSWGKAALKTLCGSASEDEEASQHRPSEEDGAGTIVRGRPTAARINEKRHDTEHQLHSKVMNPNTNRPRGTPHIYGQKVIFDLANVPAAAVTLPPVPIPSTAAAERSLSPNSNTSEPAEIVIAVSTPPPQSAVPNDSVIDLSTHPYAQFPASAPYAGPYPSSRDYKPLYTPRHNNFRHRSQPSSNPEVHPTTTFGHPQVPSTSTASIRPHDVDPHPPSRKETDPTPYAYANVGESSKRESKLGVEEALISSSFRGFSDVILEDESNVLVNVKTPKHSPGSFVETEEEEQKYHYAILNETSPSPNIAPSRSTQVYGKAQYVQSLPQDPNTTTMSSPSSQNSSYSWMSRPLGAVDDLDQFRDLFFRRPHNSPGTVSNVGVFDSSDDFGFYQRSPITSSSQFLGTPGLPPQSPVQQVSTNDREQRMLDGRFNLQPPSFTNTSPQLVPSGSVEVDYVVPQDFPEDIESSRASSVIEPDTFVEDTLRLGIVPLSVPITTESVEQRHSTTLSFVDSNINGHNRDTVISTASAYSVPSVNKDGELRQSFVTNDSSTSGVAKLLGNFPSPPPPTRIDNSRPDSYHVLGLAESRHIMTPASSPLIT